MQEAWALAEPVVIWAAVLLGKNKMADDVRFVMKVALISRSVTLITQVSVCSFFDLSLLYRRKIVTAEVT